VRTRNLGGKDSPSTPVRSSASTTPKFQMSTFLFGVWRQDRSFNHCSRVL
jgi:hypothetical protein